MTSDKLNTIIDLCIENNATLIMSVDDINIYIPFEKGKYEDTFTDEKYLYYWNYVFNNWNLLPINKIHSINIKID